MFSTQNCLKGKDNLKVLPIIQAQAVFGTGWLSP